MTVFDFMYFLACVAVVAVLLAALDGVVFLVLHLRNRRRYRALQCACGEWPAPAYFAGVVHEPARCYPQMEEA